MYLRFWIFRPFKMRPLRCFQTSGTSHPVPRRRIPEEPRARWGANHSTAIVGHLHYLLTFCWPCIMQWFLVISNLTHKFLSIYLFIVLYMFRACHAHHQEKQIVSIQILVNVTPCWWLCCVLVGCKLYTQPVHNTATNTEWNLTEAVLI